MKKRSGFYATSAMLFMAGMALCLLVPGQANSETIVIDSMAVGQGDSDNPVASDCGSDVTPTTVPTTGADIYGLNRVLEITHLSGSACTKTYVDSGTPKNWVVVNDTDSNGWGRIVWSGAPTIGAYDLPPLNLTNLQYFNIVRVGADHPTTFRLQVFSDAAHGSQATIITYGLGGGDAQNVHVLPGAFTDIGGLAAADFSSIKEIRILFDAFLEIDTALRGLSVVTQAPPNVHCNYKTLNGQSALIVTNTAPPYNLTVAFAVQNDGGTASQIVVEDIMPNGMNYTGPTTCDGGFVLGVPSQIGQTLTWTSTTSLGAGSTVTCSFPAVLNSLDLNATKTNVLRARAILDEFGPEECQASVTRRETAKVPSMNEWGAMLTFIILAAGGFYLARRRREV